MLCSELPGTVLFVNPVVPWLLETFQLVWSPNIGYNVQDASLVTAALGAVGI
jgi:hypothetical protein